MKKSLLILILLLTVAGCSSLQGYQGEIDETCTRMHNICGAVDTLCKEGLVDPKNPANCDSMIKGCLTIDDSCRALN